MTIRTRTTIGIHLANRRRALLVGTIAVAAAAFGAACTAESADDPDVEAAQEADLTLASAVCSLKGKGKNPTTHGEAPVAADERQLLDEIIKSGIDTIRQQAKQDGAGKPGTPFGRDVHTRAQGCLRGKLKIAGKVAADLEGGIFRAGAEYPIVARLSNGGQFRSAKDSKPTTRGFAFKLLGLDPSKGATQDFVMHNTQTFFIRELSHYKVLLDGARDDASILDKLRGPLQKFDRNECNAFAALLTLKVDNPMAVTYFSGAPYKMKNTAVKYKLEPCGGAERGPGLHLNQDGYLRKAVVDTLTGDGACYDFSIQRQTPADWIEDPTVAWKGGFEKVAQLTVPKQDPTKLDEFCEYAQFTPDHTWQEHKPIGQLNRVRGTVYKALFEERQRMNIERGTLKGPVSEPTGKERIFSE